MLTCVTLEHHGRITTQLIVSESVDECHAVDDDDLGHIRLEDRYYLTGTSETAIVSGETELTVLPSASTAECVATEQTRKAPSVPNDKFKCLVL
jgi:hypothetical protein